MRSRSLARVVMATLGVSVIITLGCGGSPSGPSVGPPFSVLSISPTEGSSDGATSVVIGGTGFLIKGRAGATVAVDGRPVNASPSVDGNTIRLVMPAHAAGKADVTVIGPLGQAQASVPGGYTYVTVPTPPPVIRELVPNIGTTSGGTLITIKGEFRFPVTVSVAGIVTPFESDDYLYLSTPAHAAGTVEVIVTNADGQTASREFTYVSPATLDFNGDWQGWARLELPPVPVGDLGARLVLTIRNNIAVNVSCWECRPGDTVETCAIVRAPSLTLEPPPVVANGEFSFAGSGVSITGKILSPNYASGSITMASCGSRQWTAERK